MSLRIIRKLFFEDLSNISFVLKLQHMYVQLIKRVDVWGIGAEVGDTA